MVFWGSGQHAVASAASGAASGTSPRWGARLALAVLLGLSALGCSARQSERATGSDPTSLADAAAGDSAAPAADAASGGSSAPQPNGAPGAPGALGNRGGQGEAVGAPIKIPSAITDEGLPLADVRARIEEGIRADCGGGALCVHVRVDARESGFNLCQFVRTEPGQGSYVDRGSTVVIVSGIEPCPSELPSGQPAPGTPTGSQSSPGTAGGGQPSASRPGGGQPSSSGSNGSRTSPSIPVTGPSPSP